MKYLSIPEWEIEEIIEKYPVILGLDKKFKNPKLLGKQVFLNKSGRFIDLLFITEDKNYIIVELKKTFIDDISVLYDQLLKYKIDLASELKVPKNQIFCMLASPKGFAANVIQSCKEEKVYWKHIDEKLISQIFMKKSYNAKDIHLENWILKKRHPKIYSKREKVSHHPLKHLKSVQHYIKSNEHDETAKKGIAKLFKKISFKAPLCAHEVFHSSYECFKDDSQRWFWIFYSVLDRRANAVTFVKAGEHLKKNHLFDPEAICDQIKKIGKQQTIQLIHDSLEISDFPLCSDSIRHEYAMPSSIVEAAQWYKKYEFSIKNVKNSIENLSKYKNKMPALELIRQLKENIYGVGERIGGQIVRGFILKDKWDWKTNYHQMLEKCDFNILFASKLRLGLVSTNQLYYKELINFGDLYLDGNYSMISHVLWYIRKRYCLRPKRCFECPIAGYCNYYCESLYWNVSEYEITLFDTIHLQNK